MAVTIRSASTADAEAIARVRRESWFAAYSQLIDPGLIDRATASGGDTADPPPYRTTLVAVATADATVSVVVGYAAFGPERAVDSAAPPTPGVLMPSVLTPAGFAGQTGELYAIYTAPAWWSTGTGLALMDAALAALGTAGYRRAVLWTLTGNARARRFYEKTGFALDGATNILAGLGGVEEVRYARDLAGSETMGGDWLPTEGRNLMSGREHAERTPGEEQWLRVSAYLHRDRFALGIEAAQEYPALARLAGTPLLTADHWRLPAPIPLDRIRLEFLPWAAPAAAPDVASLAPYALPERADGTRYRQYAEVIEALAAPAIFENRPTYRLLAATLAGDDPRLVFTRGRFFDGVNIGGPAGLEYAAARLGLIDRCVYRDAFVDPTDLAVRPTALATSALTLRHDRAAGTATFPMHLRDPALVGHAGGLYQVIPVGIFQPSGDAAWNEANDFSLWRGLLREYAEELLGASEDYGSEEAPIDYQAWPLAKAMTDGLADGSVRAYCLGLGTDPLTFAIDLLTVVVIDAPLYDELFGALVTNNAEGRVIRPRPFDEPAIIELTTREPVQAAAAALLTLAWEHRDILLS